MQANLEGAILDTLYRHYKSHPGSPTMTLGGLYKSIGVSPNDNKKVGEVRYQLFSLRKKRWVEFQILEDGSGGTVEITSEGIKVAEDRRQAAPPTPQPEIREPPEEPKSKEVTSEAGIPKLCPAILEGVIREDQTCARLFQRHDLLDEIRAYFGQVSSTCNFVVLYGEPMVGKTQILVRLSKVLGNEYVPLKVTSQGLGLSALGDLNAFAFDLAIQLQDRFRRWASHCGVSFSLNDPDRKDFQNGRGIRAFYAYWYELRGSAGNRRPVVMFDEVERLLDHPDKLNPQILTFLDDFVSNLENGCVIIAGSERILRLHNDLFTMLIGKGQPIRVRYYTDETVSLVFSAIQKYFTFEEDFLHYLIALCDGHPRLLSAAYRAAKSLSKQRLEKNDIEVVLNKLIDLTNPVLQELLRHLTTDERAVVWLVSQDLSGPVDGLEFPLHKLLDSASQLPAKPGAGYDLSRGVDYLVDREWMEWKNGKKGLLRFRLGIFPLWFRHRHIPPIRYDEVGP
jgi:hypothetical protein